MNRPAPYRGYMFDPDCEYKGLSPKSKGFIHGLGKEIQLHRSSRKKVCIMGAADMGELVPMDDESYEIWGCNALWRMGFTVDGYWRADRWFELHPADVQSTKDIEWLKVCPIQVYCLNDELHDVVPHRVSYPITEITARGYRVYYTNTFAYQIALAIYEGFDEIKLCNIWLENGRELCVERACVDYWCGFAEGKGIVIDTATDVPIASHPFLYGYDYVQEKEYVESKLRRVLTSVAHDGWSGSV